MAFGNEELRELRAQLVEASHGSQGSREERGQGRGASSAEDRYRAAPGLMASGSEAVRPAEGPRTADLLIQHLRGISPVSPPAGGRIRRKTP